MRLDLYLLNKIPDLSRTYIKKAILDGLVTVNSEKSNPSYKLRADDRVEFNEEKIKNHYKTERASEIVATKIDFEIVFEDDEILVVNKPAGLDSHPVPQNMKNTLLNGVMHYLKETKQFIKPRLVHRLDKDTSGVIIIAKTYKSNEVYSKYFESGKVQKYYLALVKGDLKSKAEFADKAKVRERSFLARSSYDKRKMDYAEALIGQRAITDFMFLGNPSDFDHHLQLEAEVLLHTDRENLKFRCSLEEFLEYAKQCEFESSIVLALPETGRTHQIRVHLEHMGSPIIGDKLYSSLEYPRMMLHAWGLGIAGL